MFSLFDMEMVRIFISYLYFTEILSESKNLYSRIDKLVYWSEDYFDHIKSQLYLSFKLKCIPLFN